MNRNAAVLLSLALLGSASLTVNGQQMTPVFTAAQAEAGRAAYENSCGRRHTYSLRGRRGEEGELPSLASLPAPYRKFIGTPVHVPALMGKDFVRKYGQKKVADMYSLFRGAADTTPVAELHMSNDTLVDITAYILQMNGAKPGNQPLTSTLSTAFNSVVQ